LVWTGRDVIAWGGARRVAIRGARSIEESISTPVSHTGLVFRPSAASKRLTPAPQYPTDYELCDDDLLAVLVECLTDAYSGDTL
jgi:hypothetical protein